METIPSCPNCGCVGEITFSWRQDWIEVAGITKPVPCVVNVQECNVCREMWTDHHSEHARQHAVDDALKVSRR